MKFFNYTLLIKRTWKRSHKSVGSGSEYEASLGFLWSDCNILKTLTSWKESKTCFMKGTFIRHLRLRVHWEGVAWNCTVRLFWGRCRFFYCCHQVPQETDQVHGKTGNPGWKIKWFEPFHLGSLRKYGLWFEIMPFFHYFSVSLRAILTPKRNWRQCLCKILGWQTKSITVCYRIFWSGQSDLPHLLRQQSWTRKGKRFQLFPLQQPCLKVIFLVRKKLIWPFKNITSIFQFHHSEATVNKDGQKRS